MAEKKYRSQRRSIKAFTVANRDDLMGDLGFSQDQLSTIEQNLLTAGSGLARTLTATQRRELAAMERIANVGNRRTNRAVKGAERDIRGQYGSAIAAAAAPELLPAKGIAAGSRVATKGALAGGKKLATGGQVALAIQQAAAAEAAEGAQYAMAVALKQRSMQDSAAAAEMQFALDQMRLQADLELRNQKEMFRFTQEQEEKLLGGRKGATDAAETLGGVMPDLRLAVGEFVAENGRAPTFEELGGLGITVPPSVAPIFQEVYARMVNRGLLTSSQGYEATADAIVDSMVAANPKLRDMADKLHTLVLASLKSSWNARTIAVASQSTPAVGGIGQGTESPLVYAGRGGVAFAGQPPLGGQYVNP